MIDSMFPRRRLQEAVESVWRVHLRLDLREDQGLQTSLQIN